MNKVQLSTGILLMVLAAATHLTGSDVIVYPLAKGQATLYLSAALVLCSLVLIFTSRKRWS
ncbi:MAG: hypothetical protein JSV61_07830 [Anaerolineales bacterium]|nr:MAG: hypothetical protein JSV61_07830 [Anaerolineales bacterium]